jgi:hypothetical protein
MDNDDINRTLLTLLPPKYTFMMLSLNKYWNQLPDEHLWKIKLNNEYPFYEFLYKGCKLKEKYRLLSLWWHDIYIGYLR